MYGIAPKYIHCGGKTKFENKMHSRRAHQNCSDGFKTSFTRRGEDDRSARTSVRDWGHHVILWSPPPPPPSAARLPRYARAGTDARCVRPPRTMGKTPATTPLRQSGGGVPPRRGCTTARVQHPAVEISETGLGDAPPERDPYTIKIARVGTYNTRTTIR